MRKMLNKYWMGWVKCAEIMGPGAFIANHCAFVPEIVREYK